MLRELDFQQVAIGYIRAQLASNNGLGSYLLELPLELGTVQTIMPANVRREELRNFSVGGLMQRALSEPPLVEFVSSYLVAGRDRCALFEDAAARSEDAYVRRSRARYVVHESEVIYVGTPNDAASQVASTLRAASSFLFVGALTVGDFSEVPQGGQIPSSTLRRVALASKHVLVSAYDDESVLIWSGP